MVAIIHRRGLGDIYLLNLSQFNKLLAFQFKFFALTRDLYLAHSNKITAIMLFTIKYNSRPNFKYKKFDS